MRNGDYIFTKDIRDGHHLDYILASLASMGFEDQHARWEDRHAYDILFVNEEGLVLWGNYRYCVDGAVNARVVPKELEIKRDGVFLEKIKHALRENLKVEVSTDVDDWFVTTRVDVYFMDECIHSDTNMNSRC